MKRRTPLYIYLILITFVLFLAFVMFSNDGYSFLSRSTFYVLLFVSYLILMVGDVIGRMIESERFKKLSETDKHKYIIDRKTPYFTWLYNDAFAKRQTEDNDGIEILDHGFDGITELDNQLPRWWLGLFYFGVGCCIVYTFSFFTSDFAHPLKELDEQTRKDTAEINIVNKLTLQVSLEDVKYDAANIDVGKQLFVENCASCHKADGGGGIGPNLTDDNWINIMETDLIRNIAHLPWNGSKNNPTMRSFINSGELKANQIQKIAAYIYHINQEIPNARGGPDAQGKIVQEWAKDPIPSGAEVKTLTEIKK